MKPVMVWMMLAVALWGAVSAVQIWMFGNTDEKRSSDVIIVLGAAVNGEKPSPVFRERLNHGIRLYRNGYAGKLILTGGVSDGNTKSDARIAAEYAKALGIPEEDILLEEYSTITQENIRNAKEMMDAHGFSSAILVSDPLHMKRAMCMAADYGMDAVSSPTPTTRYQSLKTKFPFLARETFFYLGYRIVRIFL
jgi:uncharacterized SAM-binding protein YcdF (DUF218 family)